MAQYDINLREYWRILKKRRILVIFSALAFGLFSTFFAILKAPTPLYSSTCSIKFEKQTTLEGLYARTISWPGSDDIKTQMSIIKGYYVFQQVAERLRLVPKDPMREESATASGIIHTVENLQSKVEVTREENTNILDIQATDANPVFSQRLANTTALVYKDFHAEEQTKRTTEAIKYIGEQLKAMRQKLRKSEEEFNKFSHDNQLVSIDLQSEALLTSAREIQGKIRGLQENRREFEAILERLSRFIVNPTGSGGKFYSSAASNEYQATNKNLVDLMIRRDTLLEDYTPQHPEVVGINRKITESARKMAVFLQLQIGDIEKNVADMRRELEEVERKTHVLLDKKLEFDRLKRNVQLHNDMTALLEQKNQEALIREAEKPEEVTIVKPALLPTQPVNPPRTAATGAMGTIIGIVLGLVLALIVETFDTSLSVIEDVEETLGSQVLGVIPHADEKDIQYGLKDKYPEEAKKASEGYMAYLVSHFIPKSMIAESFRALRTNIQFKETEQATRTIAVASTSPQEGKTMVSINLAITMAQTGMKVLLVGSDLRKPMLAKVFGVESTPGVTDILLGNYPWRDTVKGITDIILGKMSLEEVMMTPGLDNLHIITGGEIPSNPAELIDSDHLSHFIEEAKEEYDIVIFDSTPLLSAADGVILGTKVDGVLLVYRIGAVSRRMLKRSTAQLQQVNCRIMGVILNGMRPELSPDFQDFKYYKYYYSYGEDGKERRGIKEKGDSGQEDGDQEGEKSKKLSPLKLTLAGVALLLVAMGVLWHSGLQRPIKPLLTERHPKKEEIVRSVRGKVSREAIETKPKPENPTPKERLVVSSPGAKSLSLIETRSYPYSLYLGSYRNADLAKRAISVYTRRGLSPYWVEIEFKKIGHWFRVFAGHFETRKQAEGFRQRYKLEEAEIKHTAFGNLVGTYSHRAAELEIQIRSLKELGYSPYVIEESDRSSRLFVGAFVTKMGAETQCQQLKSKGVNAEVVLR